MRFRQLHHDRETPVQYIQRRVKLYCFLYGFHQDGQEETHRLILTLPTEWMYLLQGQPINDIMSLQTYANNLQEALDNAWYQMHRERQRFQRPRVMLAEEEEFEIVTEESSSFGNHINLFNHILASEVRD
jgi:hypothetical protein